MQYFVRPENGQKDQIGPTLGPFDDYIQLTYSHITVGPDGETIAYLEKNGLWYFTKTYLKNNVETPIPFDMEGAHRCPHFWESEFSDVIIFAK